MSARRTPLAWRNIAHNKVTLVVSSSAVAFAVVIMFMELGFLNGLYDSQTGALQFLRADLVMVSSALHIFNSHETFARSRLAQAAAIDGVKAVYPVYLEDRSSSLRNPDTGIQNVVRVIGFDLGDPVFESREIIHLSDQLRTPMTILFAAKSRSFLGSFKPGTRTELANRAVTVAGSFDLGPNYYYDGNVITSSETLFALFSEQQRDRVFLGVVELAEGASSGAVLRELRRAMAPDIHVLSKSGIIAREKATLRKSTPAGYIFTMGLVVGFIIGIFICYQILYTDIADHLPQLATMKALGYQNRALVRLVLAQAVMLGIIGFVPALAATFGLYSALTAMTGIVTKLTLGRTAFVFALTIGMCLVSGLLAVRKALAADPAELF